MVKIVILDSKTFSGVSVDILEHLGMKEPDIEGHGVIMGGASVVCHWFLLREIN